MCSDRDFPETDHICQLCISSQADKNCLWIFKGFSVLFLDIRSKDQIHHNIDKTKFIWIGEKSSQLINLSIKM